MPQKSSSELSDGRRKLTEEAGKRDQLEQMVGLLRAQLTRVTAEAEDGAATIAKLKSQIAGLTGPDGVNVLPDIAFRTTPSPTPSEVRDVRCFERAVMAQPFVLCGVCVCVCVCVS